MIFDITDSKKMNLIEEYADLIVLSGINLQPGQPVILRGPIETADFMRLIAKKCYQAKASYVLVDYIDSLLEKERYLNAPIESISYFPKWKADGFEELCKNDACFIRISGEDPDIFSDVSSEILSIANKTNSMGMKTVNKYILNSDLSWVVAAAPTKAWAKKIFPDISQIDAVNKLWDYILKASRVTPNSSVNSWKIHNKYLANKCAFLNNIQFKALHYNSLGNGVNRGTDLTIELPKNHIWSGGSEVNKNGIIFNANIPTEEVFTAPSKYGINGYVSNTLPFNFNGNIIDDFELIFKNGKIVDFTAKKGYDILKSLLNTDEGSVYIGEIALVPNNSPISMLNTIFYNTLFDENASCHLAFGSAYPSCIKNGTSMNDDELEKHGLNTSLIHYDFMVGCEKLNINGITSNGDKIKIFENGNWAF
ncbi:MAG: aminopeptidase [Proteocatella sp.]